MSMHFIFKTAFSVLLVCLSVLTCAWGDTLPLRLPPSRDTYIAAYEEGMLRDKCDLVVFSYNRPMQLYALLESTEMHTQGINKLHVVYRSDNDEYDAGYDIVFKRFPNAILHKQSRQDPRSDFATHVYQAVFDEKGSSCPYIMFAVDDIIVTHPIDIAECTAAMRKYNAWGFFFRLGLNTTYCYSLNCPAPVPVGTLVGENEQMFMWKFEDGNGDWAYPNSVDYNIYSKKDVLQFLTNSHFYSPNSLEASWARRADMGRRGLCYTQSANVNIPLNLVNISHNRNMGAFTPEELLEIFLEGKKIDVVALAGFVNVSPHQDVELSFIAREDGDEETALGEAAALDEADFSLESLQ